MLLNKALEMIKNGAISESLEPIMGGNATGLDAMSLGQLKEYLAQQQLYDKFRDVVNTLAPHAKEIGAASAGLLGLGLLAKALQGRGAHSVQAAVRNVQPKGLLAALKQHPLLAALALAGAGAGVGAGVSAASGKKKRKKKAGFEEFVKIAEAIETSQALEELYNTLVEQLDLNEEQAAKLHDILAAYLANLLGSEEEEENEE